MARGRSSGTATLFALRKSRRRDEPGALFAQLDAAALPAYETELRFDRARRWRFDVAWPLFKIAIEIEGGAHGRLIVVERGVERRKGASVPIKAGTRIRVGGRHQSGPGFEGDIEKYNAAALQGWLVLRCTTRQIRDGLVVPWVRAAFKARGLE